MFQESGFLSAKGFNLHYIKAGNGPKALLSFHGFDRTGSDFMVFEKSLGNIYTIYAFDSLYHGKSYLQHDVAKSFMSKNDLCDLLQKFMVEKSYSRISLFGYSMGGRIALCILETMPGQIDDVFLMAPDGIKRDIWNTFATKSNIGKWLFKGVVKNPSLFLKLLKLLQSFRLIHPKAVHYIIGQMKEEENRLRLMKVWTMHKELIPEMERIPKIIFRYRVNFLLFYGRYDSIITPESGRSFASKIKNKTCYFELECGHKLFDEHNKISEIIIESVSEK